MTLPLRVAEVVDVSDGEPIVTRTYASLTLAIRSERRRRGLRQSELAARLGVRREQVVRWEGGTKPDRENLEVLADVLGLVINEDGTVSAPGELEELPPGTPVVIVVVGTADDAVDVLHRLGLTPPGEGRPD